MPMGHLVRNAGEATQNLVNTPLPKTYFISSNNKSEYSTLPTPHVNGAPNMQKPWGGLRHSTTRSQTRSFSCSNHRLRTRN